MKTMGRVAARWAGWLMTVEKSRLPAGATQTLAPRPRPATWVVAVRVKPVGSLERSLWFLAVVSAGLELGGEGGSPFEHRVGAGDDLSVQQHISPLLRLRLPFPKPLQARVVHGVVEAGCFFWIGPSGLVRDDGLWDLYVLGRRIRSAAARPFRPCRRLVLVGQGLVESCHRPPRVRLLEMKEVVFFLEVLFAVFSCDNVLE